MTWINIMWLCVILASISGLLYLWRARRRVHVAPHQPDYNTQTDHRAQLDPSVDAATSFVAATALHEGLADQQAASACSADQGSASGDAGCAMDGGGGAD